MCLFEIHWPNAKGSRPYPPTVCEPKKKKEENGRQRIGSYKRRKRGGRYKTVEVGGHLRKRRGV